MYVGTYTAAPLGGGEGIYAFDFDPETGAVTATGVAAAVANPAWLALNPDKSVMYAGLEVGEGEIAGLRIDAGSGELSEINRVSSEGASPCYVSLTADGRYVLVANYTSGTVAVLPVEADGRLEMASDTVRHEGSSVNPDRQGEPHTHMISPSPDGGHVLVTDLGTDEVIAYRLDEERGILGRSDETRTVNTATAGSGPRHFAFSPDGGTVYVINELDSTLAVSTYDAETGALRQLQTVAALPEGYEGVSYCAQVLVSPDGRFVYGSNRGHDSIVIWQVDEGSGTLTAIDHVSTQGKFPRNFNLDPSGRWLVVGNQNSDSLVVFARDEQTGGLTQVGEPIAVPAPVAIVFV